MGLLNFSQILPFYFSNFKIFEQVFYFSTFQQMERLEKGGCKLLFCDVESIKKVKKKS